MIVYLHGFRSGPQSSKVQTLAQRLTERGFHNALWCEQLSPVPFEAITQVRGVINNALAEGKRVTLVGSSLGGFYATWLAEQHDLRAVLINPFVPHPNFDASLFIGQHTPIYGGPAFEFTPAHVEQIHALDLPFPAQPERFWLLAETGDETLDYRHAVDRYAGARHSVLPGGNHTFSRWGEYLDAVIDFAEAKA